MVGPGRQKHCGTALHRPLVPHRQADHFIDDANFRGSPECGPYANIFIFEMESQSSGTIGAGYIQVY